MQDEAGDAGRADVTPLPVAVEFNQPTAATLVSTSAAGKQNGKQRGLVAMLSGSRNDDEGRTITGSR